jgi:hypothetical protein
VHWRRWQPNNDRPNLCSLHTERHVRDHGRGTSGVAPRAWRRQGAQNVLLDSEQRDRLRRDKRILWFENEYCCEYDPNDLDRGLLDEFKKVFHADAKYPY